MADVRIARVLRSCSLLVALALGLALAWPAAADADGIEVSELRVRSPDPTEITFSARVAAPEGLQEAELVYRVLNPKEGDVGGSVVREDFAPGREFDVSVTLETRTSQRYIPIGSQFRYHWRLTGADGSSLVTDEESYLFLDGRYPWVSVQEGDVTVYYYGTAHDRSERVAQATRSAIEDTEELLQVKVPFPVRVMVWASEADGELAMRSRGLVFDELVRTGGQRVGSDLLFVFSATMDVVRHEAAHIVTSVAGDGPFTSIPSWLDEGTAVYMQNSQLNYDDAVAFAIAADRTIRLRNMEAPSNNPNEVNLFYGQSWSVVDYMLEEFGEQRFAELYRVIREGATTDSGLQQIYGVDQDGLYNLWRVAKGLEAIDYAPRVEATAAPVAEGTRAPLAIPTSIGSSGDSGDREEASPTTTPESAAPAAPAAGEPEPEAAAASEDGGGSNTMIAIVIGLVTLLLGGGLGGAAFYLARRPG
ncbi:MAG: hypothetical protein F4X76_13290 [Chloroflexi bacterium]|nr:hypothetical protein [Chloroflexota bacterium]